MDRPTEAYPLTWPTLQPRTPHHRRREARFMYAMGRSVEELMRELRLLGGQFIVLSSNVPTRRDGLPLASARQPEDPGVAVYFERPFRDAAGRADVRPYVIACDAYRKVEWNVRAVGVTVEALRTIHRHGATEMLEQAFSGFAALPAPAAGRSWWEVLGVARGASLGVATRAYRELAAIHHPDAGGSHERMAEINRAFEQAKAVTA